MELADVIRAMRDALDVLTMPNAYTPEQRADTAVKLSEAKRALEQAQREIAHHNNTREVLDV